VLWQQPAWLTYLAGSLALGASMYVTHRIYARELANGVALRHHRLVMPISYTLSSALLGGAQMIVHSKVVSELIGLIFQGQSGIFMTWVPYVELILLVTCGAVWLFKLTECLALFDPLLILPLMVGSFITFGGIAGGIYFREFERLHEGFAGYAAWAAYSAGVLCVLGGLGLIAVASAEVERDLEVKEEWASDDAPAAAEPATRSPGLPPLKREAFETPPRSTPPLQALRDELEAACPPPVQVPEDGQSFASAPVSATRCPSSVSRKNLLARSTPANPRSAGGMPTPMAMLRLEYSTSKSMNLFDEGTTFSPPPRSSPSRSPGPSNRDAAKWASLFLEPVAVDNATGAVFNRPGSTPTRSATSRPGGTPTRSVTSPKRSGSTPNRSVTSPPSCRSRETESATV